MINDPNVLHPETAEAVDEFVAMLRAKLIRAQQKRGHFTEWKYDEWKEECQRELLRHVAKGDPLDVAAYAMFCWARGWQTAEPAQASTEGRA